MEEQLTNQSIQNNDIKENKVRIKRGIFIPRQCGYAVDYDLVAIMYHDENSNQEDEEYQVFITKKDFEDEKPFAKIHANMNPEIILVPISERECMDLVAYDPSLNDEIEMTRDGIKAIILSSIVNGLSEWIMTAKDRSEYIYIVPGEIRERYVANSHVEYVIP